MGQAEAIVLFLSTVTHFALILLPCFAVCVVAVRKGIRDILLLGLMALLTIAASGYLAFWLWLISAQLGRVFSLCLPIAAAISLIWTFPRLDPAGRSTLTALLNPLALTGSVALLVLSTGFMFGGLATPLRTPATRFSHPLPPDNEIPFLFAEGIRSGPIPKPLLGNWESSDRPPLQTGIVLSQCVYLQHPRRLQYTVISVILQSLWIFGLWLFLASFEVDPRSIALALAVCLFSGFVFTNSFYVWPKLLAAAYMLGFANVLLADRFAAALRETILVPVLAGALAALGLLAHGGSMFAVLGIIFTLLVTRKRVNAKALTTVAIACICLYLPWIAYQRFYDPPGDRLLKYHLAGVEKVDNRSFLPVFIAAYENLSLRQFLNNKAANAIAALDHQAEYWHSILQLLRQLGTSDAKGAALLAQTASTLRGMSFFYLVPSLGFLVIGPVSLLLGVHRRQRTKEWRIAAMTWLYITFTVAIWCLLLFIPAGTVIHTGTYAVFLLAYAGSVLALWAVSPWLAVVLGSLQVEINFLLYISFMPPPVLIGSPDQGSLRFGTVGLTLLSLTCTLFLLRSLARRQTARPE